MSYKFYPFSTLPRPFDTVWCLFPYNENPEDPGPIGHPGLIRQAFADDKGNPWVRVVYGTSVDPFRGGNEYFAVSKVSEMEISGLKCATRFCLGRHAELPWSEEFFITLSGLHTPIIGRLSDYGQRLLQMQISYHQHEKQKNKSGK